MPMNRRDFLRAAALIPFAPIGCARLSKSDPAITAGTGAADAGVVLNDIHSMLNATRVREVVPVGSLESLVDSVTRARKQKLGISVAGGRHAMGAQQFGTGTIHLDTRPLNRVLAFDPSTGLIEVEAGIQWPKLVDDYLALQKDSPKQWGFTQKQTGADRLSVGGALSANAHGRGLTLKPLVESIVSLKLVNAQGDPVECNRTKNADLFRLVCGGYGLFGPVYSVTMQLAPRRKLRRDVAIIDAAEVPAAIQDRTRAGYLYGDFQFAIDPKSPDFLRKGVFACYFPVADSTPMPEGQKELAERQWTELLTLAHTDKTKAFEKYSKYYLSTQGQLYWSDTHQMSIYPDGYHLEIDKLFGRSVPGSEMITEIYVPREKLPEFLEAVAKHLRDSTAELIYGTCRFIEKDNESFLPWAKESYACTVMNLHVDHSPEGIVKARDAFRGLIDIARARGGSYFLTYHKWATREQVLACYPQFPQFLARKKEFDPDGRFQSDWYRHHVELLG